MGGSCCRHRTRACAWRLNMADCRREELGKSSSYIQTTVGRRRRLGRALSGHTRHPPSGRLRRGAMVRRVGTARVLGHDQDRQLGRSGLSDAGSGRRPSMRTPRCSSPLTGRRRGDRLQVVDHGNRRADREQGAVPRLAPVVRGVDHLAATQANTVLRLMAPMKLTASGACRACRCSAGPSVFQVLPASVVATA